MLTRVVTGFLQWPDNVRVAAHNRLVFTVTRSGTGPIGQLRDIDLATGGVVSLVQVSETTPLAVSGNRERVLALLDNACCPEEALVYNAATAAFGPRRQTIAQSQVGVAADYAGSTFLIGNNVYTSALAFVKALHAPGAALNAAALSPDGFTAYLATTTGVARVRVADDTVLETFPTNGQQPVAMRLSTDGLTLGVATASRVFVIDVR